MWSRLGSNQRPSACEADALPLSHGTGAERRTRSKISTRGRVGENVLHGSEAAARRTVSRKLCGPARVGYRRASRRATISSVARGCSAVGSASPCQGEGRGFESRLPLEASGFNPSGGVAEWRGNGLQSRAHGFDSRLHLNFFDSGAVSSAGERFPDTEEVAGSIPVPRTSIHAGQASS